MTMTSYAEAHPRAVASFQALLSKHSPGTSHYRIAERALDLAFNSSCACGATTSEQGLLVQAEILIQRQVRAKLIPGPSTGSHPFSRTSNRIRVRIRQSPPRTPVRRRVAEFFVQGELWMNVDERSGFGRDVL